MEKIVASLKYGRIHRKSLFFLWVMFAFGIFLVIYSFIFLFGVEQSVIGFIGVMLAGIIFLGTALYIIIKNYINCKSCKKWVQDAVALNAISEGIKKAYFGFSDIGLRKLKVSFKYDKKKYVKYSGTKQGNGYDRVFFRYADAEIKILYSPKFDEVMILNDK
ncbi:MAG: hypothetical protein IJV83_03815 [Clostridia bacterium]|nr:hypothetical protein [Clostridia bacterium]